MHIFAHDLRYALRQLRKNLGITLAIVFVLGVGLAANAVTFTILKATLLRPLPYREPDRLVQVWETRTTGEFAQMEASYPDFVDFRDHNEVFEKLGGYSLRGATVRGPQGAEQVDAAVASGNFFDVLGARPLLGRVFRPEEDLPQAEKTVVLTFAGWQRRFAGDAGMIGKTIVVNDAPHVIIGVLPRDFQFAPSHSAEFWLPIEAQGWRLRRNAHWFYPIGRLKAGMEVRQAQAGMSTLAARLERQYPDSNAGVGVRLVGLREQIVGPVRPVLVLLMSAVGCLLLITCGNMAGLLLAQAVGRRKEISIRLAVGASRGRIVRQLLTESCALSFFGGAAGIALSQWLLPLAISAVPRDQLLSMPAWQNLHLDVGFLLFTLGLALLTGILFGLAPALAMIRPELRESLHEGGRSSAGPGRNRLRNILVVAEIALAIVLLHGAGLMLKSLSRVLSVDPGFQTANLLTLNLGLPDRSYPNDAHVAAFHRSLLAKLGGLPGVRGVATTSTLPLTGGNNTSRFVREGRRSASQSEEQEANSREISPNYFGVMGTPLRVGRFFSEGDLPNTPHVAIINQTLADRMFPGENPLGKRIDFTYTKDPNLWEIVGIVGDENATALDAKPNSIIYTPFAQGPDSYISVVLRTAQAPESLAVAAQGAIREMDSDVPVFEVMPMTQIIAESPSIFLRRSPAYVIAAFAGVGLLLAAVGLYGLLSYSVTQRGREFGIRMALGAQWKDLFALVVGGGMRLVLAGAAIGISGALAVAHLLASFLFNLQPGDAATLAGVAAMLVFVSFLAISNPARRAATTDPIKALRSE